MALVASLPILRIAILAQCLSWLVPAHQAVAQQRTQMSLISGATTESRHSRVTSLQAPTHARASGWLLLGGVVGGAVGLVGGGLIGAAIESRDCEGDFCGLGGFIVGGMLGESVLLPLGVHLANDRRGDFGKAALISAGIAAAGILIISQTDQGIVLYAIPVAQLITSIRIERRGRQE